jgi:UDP-glucose 4-epimerase
MRGEEVRMTGGTQTREFNYVTDTVDGLVAAGTAPGVDGRLFNLGCGVETTIRALAEQIASLVGRGSVAIGQLPDRPNEIWRMFGDSQQARALLGWKASVPLDVGLEKTVAWFHGQIAMGGSPYLI